MRRNTAFLNLSQNVSNLSNLLLRGGKQRTNRKSSFVIINTDGSNGYYVKALIKELKKYPFLRKEFGASIKQMQAMDVIVFGSSKKFDYYVEKDIDVLDRLDGRKFKAYDLINDFTYILKAIERYIVKNYVNDYNNNYDFEESRHLGLLGNYSIPRIKQQPICRIQPIKQKHIFVGDIFEEEDDREVIVNVNLNQGGQQRLVKKQHSDRPVQYNTCYDKVTVHNNWVKIGYNQYDIYRDEYYNEYVNINGDTIPVKEDRYGKKYLKFQ